VYWDRFNQIDYTYQRERIKAALSAWGVRGILPERNSIGEPNIELLAQEGLQIYRGVDGKMGFNTTATTKPLLIQSLAAAFEYHGFMVPADYADELRSYQVESMASGRVTFGAPSGMHDDRVISLALAWWAMTNTSGDGGIHL
jgi:hypothetical protein